MEYLSAPEPQTCPHTTKAVYDTGLTETDPTEKPKIDRGTFGLKHVRDSNIPLPKAAISAMFPSML